MKKGTKLISLLGTLSLVAGGVAFGLTSPEKAAAADTTTATTSNNVYTPGNLVYVNLTNGTSNKWVSNNCRIALKFSGSYTVSEDSSTTTTKTREVYTGFMGSATDGNDFFVAVVSSSDGITTWTSYEVYAYSSTSTSTSDSYLAKVNAINATTVDPKSNSGNFNKITFASPLLGTVSSPALMDATRPVRTYWNPNSVDAGYQDRASCWAQADLRVGTDSVCVSSGSTTYSSISSTWTALKSSYQALDTNVQAKFKAATANASATGALRTLYQAAARYDYIYSKYHAAHPTEIDDFAGRFSGSNSSNVPLKANVQDNAAVLVGSLGVLSVLSTGGYFFLKKKKIRA